MNSQLNANNQNNSSGANNQNNSSGANNQNNPPDAPPSPNYKINTQNQLTYGQRIQQGSRILKLIGFLLLIAIIVTWIGYLYFLYSKRGGEAEYFLLAGGSDTNGLDDNELNQMRVFFTRFFKISNDASNS
jgi:hypothetical protein